LSTELPYFPLFIKKKKDIFMVCALYDIDFIVYFKGNHHTRNWKLL
jgi:hypothetical protein